MRTLLVLVLSIVFIPLSAQALEYDNLQLLYTDAPFRPAEAAGLSILTSLGAIEGNPDGTFQPDRTLNRAEFVKIVLSSTPDVRVSGSDADNCFPDVHIEDWFSKYICLAKVRDVVGGYPDGLFHPADPVNYAEALKILGELYGYTAEVTLDSPWYEMYAQAAKDHKTDLPINMSYDHFLTRGQMARLAAAYRAEFEGELNMYRAMETGKQHAEVNQEEEEEESSSSSSSSSSDEEEEVVDSEYDIPTVSHLLQTGERSQPIADGRFTPWGDDGRIRIVEVELDKEVKSLKSMHLMDVDGNEIVELLLDKYDSTDKTWKGTLDEDNPHILPEGAPTTLLLEVVLRPFNQGGTSKEILEVSEFSLVVQSVSEGSSSELFAVVPHFPQHLTTAGQITDVQSTLTEDGSIDSEDHALLASFTFEGTTVAPSPLALMQLSFDVDQSFGLKVTNWEIGVSDSPDRHGCSRESAARINCLAIPEHISILGEEPLEIFLYATVEVQDFNDTKTIQVQLTEPGTMGVSGAIWWNDGTGRVTWIEQKETPLAAGPVWEVQP